MAGTPSSDPTQRPLSGLAIVDALCRLPLLSPTQQAEVKALAQRKATDARVLVKELLQRSWLTAYQSNLLLQGRGGELVLDHYVLVERLGEGATGQVFKARHVRMNRLAAVKVIRPELLTAPEAVKRFYREIEAVGRLTHPNVVQAYDAGPAGPTHFVAMEFVRGIDLAKLVENSGPLPAGAVADYLRQTALGLQHAHEKGMVHRDIKPANLMLAAQGSVVKILDMGLARLHRAAVESQRAGALTVEGMLTGTPDFMAPEQADDPHTVDIRADLYSLGCSGYALLAGRVPFPEPGLAQKLVRHQQVEPEALERLRPDLPAGLGAVVRKLMAKRAADRYQTPAEAATALAPWASGVPVTAVTVASTGVPYLDAATAGPDSGSTLVCGASIRPPSGSPVTIREGRPTRRRLASALTILGVGLGVVAALTLLPKGQSPVAVNPSSHGASSSSMPSPSDAVAQIERFQGEVFVTTPHGNLQARPALALLPGQGIKTGARASALLQLTRTAQLEMGSDTTLASINQGPGASRTVQINAPMSVRAFVQPPTDGLPIVLATSLVEIKALDAQFVVAGGPETLWVRVNSGVLHLHRSTERQPLEVRAGHYARVTAGRPLASRPLAAGVRVIDDFEAPMLRDWYPFVADEKKASTLTRRLVSPGKVGKNALLVEYQLGKFVGAGIQHFAKPPEDWSDFRQLHFWFHGDNTGKPVFVRLNVGLAGDPEKSVNLTHTFTDDVAAWRHHRLKWSDFRIDDLKLTDHKQLDFSRVGAMIFIVKDCKGTFQLDQIEVLEHEMLRP